MATCFYVLCGWHTQWLGHINVLVQETTFKFRVFCKSHLLSTSPITTALEISPTPLGATCSPQAPPGAPLTPATWSTVLTSAPPAPVSWAPLSLQWLSGDLPWAYQVPDVLCGVQSLVQASCYHLRTSILCSACCSAYSGSLGCGSSGFQSVSWGPTTFSYLSCRPSFFHPTYFSSRSCPSASYQPAVPLASTNLRFEHSIYNVYKCNAILAVSRSTMSIDLPSYY